MTINGNLVVPQSCTCGSRYFQQVTCEGDVKHLVMQAWVFICNHSTGMELVLAHIPRAGPHMHGSLMVSLCAFRNL